MSRNSIVVRNSVQKALFENEIKGQLSDGHWENATPHNHWHPFSDADCFVVRPGTEDVIGRNFSARRRYNLCDADLLEVVGDRMVAYARLAIAFGADMVEVLDDCLDLYGNFRGMPGDNLTGDYWDAKRKKLKAFDLAEIERVVKDESVYGHKQLIKDLRELGESMNTERPAPTVAAR